MTTGQRIDSLIASAQNAVDASLEYYSGPNGSSEKQIGDWNARETFCHLIWWHEATAQGMESVNAGDGPFIVRAPVDEMNARAVGRASGRSLEKLIEEFRPVHERLINAAQNLADPDATVLENYGGGEMSGAQRLERIAHHWNAHLEELKALE